MIAPRKITVTIDGKRCEGVAGQTILEIASAHSISIPTLCFLKDLTPWGGCRMCIVEVAGSPKVVPSCATPAMDGATYIAHTQRLEILRRATLELLFSERNHICPMCPMNAGDCDLQKQGYKHGLDRIRVPYLYPALPVDVSGRFVGIDHNRCILCARCVRTCDEIEGTHTLDIANRGIKNLVVADLGATFGTSDTCTQCGQCVANCPTGALFDKDGAFRGKLHDCQVTKTTCTECPLGCGLLVYTRENRVVNVFGDPESPFNAGHLCVKGRYETWAVQRERITTPLIKGKPATWDEAIKAIKKVADKAAKKEKALIVSPRLTNEAGKVVKSLADKFGRVGVYVANNETALCGTVAGTTQDFNKIKDADAIILLGAQPARDNGVLAAKIRAQVRKQGAKLIVLHARKSDLDRYAEICANIVTLERSFWKKVAESLKGMKRPVLVCGSLAMTPIGLQVMEKLTEALETVKGGDTLEVLTVGTSSNAVALTATGIEAVEEAGPWVDATPLKLLHMLVGDAPDAGAHFLEERYVPELLAGIECVVVQAAYRSALTDKATVVLPAVNWCDKNGTMTSAEGHELPVRAALPVKGEAREDEAILKMVFA